MQHLKIETLKQIEEHSQELEDSDEQQTTVEAKYKVDIKEAIQTTREKIENEIAEILFKIVSTVSKMFKPSSMFSSSSSKIMCT